MTEVPGVISDPPLAAVSLGINLSLRRVKIQTEVIFTVKETRRLPALVFCAVIRGYND